MAKRTYRTLLFIAAAALPVTAGHSEELVATPEIQAAFDAEFQTGAAQPTVTGATTAIEGGVASYYAHRFHGRRTASGERFDMHALTAAHRTLPFGTLVQVTNPANGASVVVRINDRGPFHGGRVIDVSHAAASELGLIGPGSGRVELAVIDG